MNPEQTQHLLHEAAAAAEEAYCPYSRFRVGAAVMSEDGEVFRGCNVENASYGLTICAERAAVAAAVGAGARRLAAVAVVGSGNLPPYPCGACRQVLAEFAAPETVVLAACLDDPNHPDETTLGALLPHAFELQPPS